MTAMGQGDTQVSPYHMALITSAVANGGKLMKPYLVSEVTNYTGTPVKKNKPSVYKELMTAEEASILTQYMTSVVTQGTGMELSGEVTVLPGRQGLQNMVPTVRVIPGLSGLQMWRIRNLLSV